MNGDFIDKSKENIQPLRSGRKPQVLAQILATPVSQHKSDLDRKIECASLSSELPPLSPNGLVSDFTLSSRCPMPHCGLNFILTNEISSETSRRAWRTLALRVRSALTSSTTSPKSVPDSFLRSFATPSYIRYLESNLLSGDRKNALLKVYERCTQAFQHEARYKNDAEYVRVWLKYVLFSPSIACPANCACSYQQRPG